MSSPTWTIAARLREKGGHSHTIGTLNETPPDLVLCNCTIVDRNGLQIGRTIVVRDGIIDRVEDSASTGIPLANYVDCSKKIVVPAYVNAHSHFYTSLLRGAPGPQPPPKTIAERLTRVVWPYDRLLTTDDVRAAVRTVLLEAMLAGTATIIDHHTSERCADGILDVIAEEVDAVGLRCVLCYEICDRYGEFAAAAGLEESGRLLRSLDSRSDRIAGMVGLHAMSTVGDDTLNRAVELAGRHGVGIHVHVAESEDEILQSVGRYGARPIARLLEAGALHPRSLLAHFIHVTPEEIASVAESGTMVVHNPQSNAMSGLALVDLVALRDAKITIGIGGDGFTQDIRREFGFATAAQRQSHRNAALLSDAETIDIGINGNATIAERLGGWALGVLTPGSEADLLVLDYRPVVPIEPHNTLWHYVRGFPGALTHDLFVAGRAVVRDGKCVNLDDEQTRAEGRKRAQGLWQQLARM